MFSIEISPQPQSRTVLHLSGRLAGSAPEQLKQQVQHCLASSPQLVFDLTELSYTDSSGLGAMLACLRRALMVNGDIRLAAVQRKVQVLIELVKADKIFTLYPTTEEALQSYRQSEQQEQAR